MHLSHELRSAEQWAQKAGAMALSMQAHLSVEEKPHNQGPVTNADIAIEHFITEQIKQVFPADQVIGEEGFQADRDYTFDQRTWFIDPIDGTRNFVARGHDFVIMIGLAIGGVAQLGVIFQPARGLLWSGIYEPLGRSLAFKNFQGQKIPLAIKQSPQPRELKLLASQSQKSRRQQLLIKSLQPSRILYKSSFGLKAMLILEAYADLYVAWSNSIMMWDSCAPCAIVKAAGAWMSFLDQEDLRFCGATKHTRPIFVANFLPDKSLLALLTDIEQSRSI